VTGLPSTFAIQESAATGGEEGLRLTLTGELDLRAAPELEDRLTRLRATRTPVSLELSRLQFIDSTGLGLLVRTVGDARIKRWRFQIEPDLPPQVLGLFKLVQLDHFLVDAHGGKGERAGGRGGRTEQS
jgi:anti-anti-sigma factor